MPAGEISTGKLWSKGCWKTCSMVDEWATIEVGLVVHTRRHISFRLCYYPPCLMFFLCLLAQECNASFDISFGLGQHPGCFCTFVSLPVLAALDQLLARYRTTKQGIGMCAISDYNKEARAHEISTGEYHHQKSPQLRRNLYCIRS